MIELRWTWKRQTDGILSSEVTATKEPTMYPVLQYRETTPNPVAGLIPGWQDVPFPDKPKYQGFD